jgi:hypothetical protein
VLSVDGKICKKKDNMLMDISNLMRSERGGKSNLFILLSVSFLLIPSITLSKDFIVFPACIYIRRNI